ncbi:MAG: hypothetical protein WCP55_17850 [Lentisphaerota bacterium]
MKKTTWIKVELGANTDDEEVISTVGENISLMLMEQIPDCEDLELKIDGKDYLFDVKITHLEEEPFIWRSNPKEVLECIGLSYDEIYKRRGD